MDLEDAGIAAEAILPEIAACGMLPTGHPHHSTTAGNAPNLSIKTS